MSRDTNRETTRGTGSDEEIDASSVVLAIASGFATFLIFGIGITILVDQWIGPAFLLGLFVGSIVGAVATAAVTAGLTGDVSSRQRRLAGGFAGYTVGFLGGFIVASRILSLDVISSIGAGVVVGFLVAGWGSRQGGPVSSESES